ncbi:ABC transporter ATP-binding protein [Tepidiphilus thermophilus]|uniref:ABC-type transporter Mla maintaining outer membrane lipid asymmetry, ATPase component MlaF n=1 Tax=Tepidiphilus thermophilus TaxID=876478 RepID=A0A0K6IVB5_9PROT|nr:ATP-binding cassette domain-containing protein [Tepidiphilus thermophilus]CUB07014.1 ABC-type transporter Mla maintaining outer membrane lipid asymmetry, ATPase component MlaF [Tepidiphilus thermophilus]
MSAVQEETAIEVHGLCNRFGAHVVHEGLDLVVPRGKVVSLVGGSGSGKTVLLNNLIMLTRPAAGSIRILGRDVEALGREERIRLQLRLGVMFQQGALFTSLTVLENVMLPLAEHARLPRRLREEAAMLKIQLAGLDADAVHRHPRELSGGMTKRAALARALALDPEILFLDEPTSGLDPVSARAFDRLVLALRDALGVTIFQITHDLDSIFGASDLVVFLARKKVLAAGTAEELAQRPEPELRAYFSARAGGSNCSLNTCL